MITMKKTNFPLLLLLLTLFLSLGWVALGYQQIRPGLKTDVDRCIDQCREDEEELSGLFACAARCEREFSEEGGRERRESEHERERERERERREREREREERERERGRGSREEEEERGGRDGGSGRSEREREPERRERERERREEEERGGTGGGSGRSKSERERERRERERERRDEEERGGRGSGDERSERERERRRNSIEEESEEQGEGVDGSGRSERKQREREEREREDPRRRRGGEDPYRPPEREHQRERRGGEDPFRPPAREREDPRRRRGREDLYQQDNERTQEEEEGEDERQRQSFPFHFRSRRFQYRYRSEHGHLRVLPKFTDKSRIFRGIGNYRLAISELNPNSLVVPHHCDDDTLIAVTNGKGIFTAVWEDQKRESYRMEKGDLMRLPAGSTIYVVNHDDDKTLRVVLLAQPINTPGEFREYFSAGSEEPRSYYRVFSSDILSRSLNTPRDQLEQLFAGEQRQRGMAVKVTREQVKALSRHVSTRGRKGGREITQGPISLLKEKPRYENNYGRLFEACPNDQRQLRQMDVSVAFGEIKQGAMMVPHYNSRQTTVILALEGTGRFEMACPHEPRSHGRESPERRGRREPRERPEEEEEGEGEEEEQESRSELRRITATVSPGDVFIVPAGHPVAVVANRDENFTAISFGLNALDNTRFFITGKNNIMEQVESEVKELTFNVPAKLVDRVFSQNPKDAYFTAGPEQEEQGQQQRQKEGENHGSLPSILKFAGFV